MKAIGRSTSKNSGIGCTNHNALRPMSSSDRSHVRNSCYGQCHRYGAAYPSLCRAIRKHLPDPPISPEVFALNVKTPPPPHRVNHALWRQKGPFQRRSKLAPLALIPIIQHIYSLSSMTPVPFQLDFFPPYRSTAFLHIIG